MGWKTIFSVPLFLGLALALYGPGSAGAADTIADLLEGRVRDHPEDSAGWRMLGQYRFQQGDYAGASQALERAVALEPDRAAAHFDLGRALLALGLTQEAAVHLRQVMSFAPDSSYAAEARALAKDLPPSPEDAGVIPASFEVNRFERPTAGVAPAPPPPPPRLLNFRLDSGAIYNSNVQLAPISRELFPQNRAGFQGFLAPHLEYGVPLGDSWRAGPLWHGYFNVNQGSLSPFNLQHYQPGVFVERLLAGETVTLASRLQYDFSYDAFGGDPFGTRHALTPSLAFRWNGNQESVLFWTVDYTRFTDEGTFPPNTSRNGWTNTVGFSHVLRPEVEWVRLLRAGVEGQLADLSGSDFSYRGIYFFGEVQFPFFMESLLGLQLGAGYRDFFESTMSPSRNESIWRAGVELRKNFNEHWSAATIFSYDRFDSRNPIFNADRSIAGLLVTFQY